MLYDTDRDEFITKGDFEQIPQNIAKIRNNPPGSSDYEAILSNCIKTWEEVQRLCDANEDDALDSVKAYDFGVKRKLSEFISITILTK